MKSSQPDPQQQQKPLEGKTPSPATPPGETWKPWGTDRNFEVNEKGQVRTKNYPLPSSK